MYYMYALPMMNNPLNAAPYISSSSSVTRTPYAADIFLEVSATKGIFKLPTYEDINSSNISDSNSVIMMIHER